MRKFKQIARCLLVIFCVNLIYTNKVQAVDDINIISETNITKEDAKTWATNKNATTTFVNLADIYWSNYANHGGVNPAIAYVQAAKETGYGKFGGVIDESYHNPCGLKTTVGGVDGDPNAHKKFDTWEDGIQAHLDHLALYAGADGYPRVDTKDPRHFSSVKGKANTIISLGGNWSSSTTYGTELLKMYRELESYANPIMYLDNPLSNSLINNKDSFTISGWSLNSSGIKEVKVYIDNNYVANANIGNIRTDVKSAYSAYVNADKSGFECNISLVNIMPGIRNLKVQAVGNDGKITEISTNINILKADSKMCIDEPINNVTVKDSIKVKGWALNASGIKEVKVYVDNKYIGNATIGKSRTDVKAVYPNYPDADKSGYEYEIATTNIVAGSKLIKVQAIGNDGTSQESIKAVNLIKSTAMLIIDEPINNVTVKDNIKVKGWALNASGIKEVKIYVDNNYIGNATIGQSRTDVKAVYPNYPDADKSGYEYTISTTNIVAGSKVIKVQAIGNDGTSQESIKAVNLIKPTAMLIIDEPINNVTVKDSIKVKGWALNASGIKEVKVYVDNKYIGNAEIGKSRSDVKEAYPTYTDADKSGYEYTISTRTVVGGNKQIKIQAIGNDSTIQENTVSVNLTKDQPRMYVDEPVRNTTVKDSIKVSGWALNASGIKEVKIYVDNNYIGNAEIGKSRVDVKGAYPTYTDADKSGYEYIVSTRTIAAGNKQIKIQAIGNDGTIQEDTVSVNLIKDNPKMYVDEPAPNTTVKDSIKVSGWALNASGVKEVKIYVDNNYIGNAEIGKSRADVKRAYPTYTDADKSGYEYIISTRTIAAGNKQIKIQAIGNDGTIQEDTVPVNLIKDNPKMYVDEPAPNTTVKDSIKVSGWALNASGVKEVKIYVDNNYIGNAEIGKSRADVKGAYPTYTEAEISGYEYNLNALPLKSGPKLIKIQAIGNDGSIQECTVNIIVPGSLIVIDPGHDYGGDFGAVATHNGIKYEETVLNMEVAIKLKASLEAKGYRVELTRQVWERPVSKDAASSLKARADFANALNADLFISIHHDSSSASSAKGTSTHYSTYKPGIDTEGITTIPKGQSYEGAFIDTTPSPQAVLSRDLANKIVNNVARDLGRINRGAADHNLYVTVNTNMPAVLVEGGFISNPDEAAAVANAGNQQKLADTIANTVKEMF